MRFRADVKCYHCARVWGEWEWAAGDRRVAFRARPGVGRLVFTAPGRARCPRCGGPTFLDETISVPTVVARAPIAERPARRRSLARAS